MWQVYVDGDILGLWVIVSESGESLRESFEGVSCISVSRCPKTVELIKVGCSHIFLHASILYFQQKFEIKYKIFARDGCNITITLTKSGCLFH